MIHSSLFRRPVAVILLVLLSLSTVATAVASAPLTRVAFGSCAGEDAPQPIWDEVLVADPDLWIWGGDNIYGDTEDMEVLRQKYQELAKNPGYARLVTSGIPILATWDDHDYGANDAGREYPMREASQEAFLDFFGVPADSPRREREGIYHAQIFGPPGKRTQVILLDTRYHRSPLERYPRDPETGRSAYKPNQDPEATLLGEDQWAWLGEELRKPAELRLIVTSIQFVSSGHIWEKWANLPREQRRLRDLIGETGAGGVVFLSGDRHHAELSRLPGTTDRYPFFDLTSSGINKSRPLTEPRPPEGNRYRVGSVYRGHHFGMVEVDWDQPDPLVSLSIVDREGRRPIEHQFPLSLLSEPGIPGPGPGDYGRPDDPVAVDTGTIRVDGKITDWEGLEHVAATGDHLYLRFATPDIRSLRRAQETLYIRIDGDASGKTGAQRSFEEGTDLELIFSAPRKPGDSWGSSARVHAHTPELLELDTGTVGLALAPTHASSWFEVRLSRAELAGIAPALAGSGSFEVSVVTKNHDTGRERLLARDAGVLPPVSLDEGTAVVELPVKPDRGVRVVALNTLWGSQYEKPEPFSRLFRALDGDVYLIQEWSRERISREEVVSWFSEHVDADRDWEAVVAGTAGSWSGTLVVTPHPVSAESLRDTPVDAGGWDFPARFAAAVIEAPAGRILAGSVHLKASGAIRTPEDERRLAEADAVNRLLLGMKTVARPDMVFLGGDFNLNGATAVMDRSTRMLDTDGSSLTVVEAPVLGDPGLFYTHGIRGLRNRLDFITYSDTSARLVEAYVLDTAILSPESLAAMNLQSADSEATDHLPVVADFILRR
ncbi:MAG TPA: alkaline phosphatase D family protein [Oceanipulchritudo sp.]|nr:alkaline phosphatase D family protein [Oceanipulchritudo sp.]